MSAPTEDGIGQLAYAWPQRLSNPNYPRCTVSLDHPVEYYIVLYLQYPKLNSDA